MRIISFLVMSMTKFITNLLYRFKIKWLSKEKFEKFKEVRLVVFLNHTSLYEVLYVGAVPYRVLWRLSRKLVAPGASETMSRPIVGTFLKFLAPGIKPISRKRDDTWSEFMELIEPDDLVTILPEGRMKRRDGLDKHGKPMTVRGGVADILKYINEGKIMFVYSGGLHHIQVPGQFFPKLFKRIKVNFEILNVSEYKKRIELHDFDQFKFKVIEDMQSRLHDLVPFCEQQPSNKI